MTESMSNEQLHARLAEITERSFSRSSRYGHVAMTTIAAVMATALAYMLVSETLLPWMPTRVVVLLWVLFAISSAWMVFGMAVLLRRRPVRPIHEVAAGAIALVFSILLTGSAVGVRMSASDRGLPSISEMGLVAWMGIAAMLVASVVCVRALMRHSRLQAMRERLERELAQR